MGLRAKGTYFFLGFFFLGIPAFSAPPVKHHGNSRSGEPLPTLIEGYQYLKRSEDGMLYAPDVEGNISSLHFKDGHFFGWAKGRARALGIGVESEILKYITENPTFAEDSQVQAYVAATLKTPENLSPEWTCNIKPKHNEKLKPIASPFVDLTLGNFNRGGGYGCSANVVYKQPKGASCDFAFALAGHCVYPKTRYNFMNTPFGDLHFNSHDIVYPPKYRSGSGQVEPNDVGLIFFSAPCATVSDAKILRFSKMDSVPIGEKVEVRKIDGSFAHFETTHYEGTNLFARPVSEKRANLGDSGSGITYLGSLGGILAGGGAKESILWSTSGLRWLRSVIHTCYEKNNPAIRENSELASVASEKPIAQSKPSVRITFTESKGVASAPHSGTPLEQSEVAGDPGKVKIKISFFTKDGPPARSSLPQSPLLLGSDIATPSSSENPIRSEPSAEQQHSPDVPVSEPSLIVTDPWKMPELQCKEFKSNSNHYSPSVYGTIGADILNQLTTSRGLGPSEGAFQRHAEFSALIHENLHSLDDEVRSVFFRTNLVPRSQKDSYWGYYLGSDCAIWWTPPQRFPISRISNYIPPVLRGRRYKTYVAGSDFSHHDLTRLFKEANTHSAVNSAAMLELVKGQMSGTIRPFDRPAGLVGQMNGGVEFVAYQLAALKAVSSLAPSYKIDKMKAFAKLNIQKAMLAYREGLKLGDKYLIDEESKLYYQSFLRDPQAAELRQFAKDFYGPDWAKQVIGID